MLLKNLGITKQLIKKVLQEELADFIDKGTVIITAHGASNENIFKKLKLKI